MGGQGSVLVVEDEIALAELFEIWLDDAYTVDTVTNGSDALDRMEHAYDAIVLDWRMPEVSGADVLAHIHDERLSPGVAVVTGMELDEDDIEMSVDAILRKPVRAEQLLDTIESIIAAPGDS